ncbi:hypothetical protein BD289DRAFT_186375 [Coniella lustricola]|uniref:Uncharacterized protein n=1 Tax=Coniella lustricola TaxID=2025994 RepID=A0A2T3AD11_9PEZI|nr:hypothetical protein BD289DRAFT_186375 [Coniella lustricola]
MVFTGNRVLVVTGPQRPPPLPYSPPLISFLALFSTPGADSSPWCLCGKERYYSSLSSRRIVVIKREVIVIATVAELFEPSAQAKGRSADTRATSQASYFDLYSIACFSSTTSLLPQHPAGVRRSRLSSGFFDKPDPSLLRSLRDTCHIVASNSNAKKERWTAPACIPLLLGFESKTARTKEEVEVKRSRWYARAVSTGGRMTVSSVIRGRDL